MANLLYAGNWKLVFILAILLIGLAIVVTQFLGAVYDSFDSSRDRAYDMPLVAQVTGVESSRQQYYYYLNGSEAEKYSFNAYVAANPADRQGMARDLGYDPSDLGHYLHQGDSLTKAAHSPWLLVRRGTHVTRWLLGRYAEKEDSAAAKRKK